MININNPDFTYTPASPKRVICDYTLDTTNRSPIVSIVTPFYNSGLEFEETAISVFHQSLQQWEWLIVNDGSNDPKALKILDKYRNIDPRIKIIDHGFNRGLSAARNTGFKYSNSDYILLLDSDDMIEPTAIEILWWYLETHPDCSFVNSYHVAFGGLNYLWEGGFHEGKLNLKQNRITPIVLIRKLVHQVVGGFDETIRDGLEDWEFWIRCAAHGYWGNTVKEYLAWYRVRTDHTDRWQNLREEKIKEFRLTFQKKYPHLYHGKFPKVSSANKFDNFNVNLNYPEVNKFIKKNNRLLIILPWMRQGGAESFTLNLIDQITQDGWQVSIITTAPSLNLWEEHFYNRLSDIFNLPNFIPIKDYPRFFRYFISSRKFDLVMVQGSEEGYRLLPMLRTFISDIPIIDYLHFVTPVWLDGGFARLSLQFQDYLNLTITSCEYVREWLINNGATPGKIKVCRINVDPNHWKPNEQVRKIIRTKLGIASNDVVIIYPARLESQKQPDVFALTMQKLSQKGVDFKAIVAGDGSLRASLIRLIRVYKLKNKIRILGSVPLEEMNSIMAAADILFLPSSSEGIAQTIYEGMACGLVIVSAKVGGQEELVTPDCGILIPITTPKESVEIYANILSGLIIDSKQREKMGKASRNRILSGFTLDKMGICIKEALLNALVNRAIPCSENDSIYYQSYEEIISTLQFLQNLQKEYLLYSVDNPKDFSMRFYFKIRKYFFPIYYKITRKYHLRWLISFKDKIKNFMVRSHLNNSV